MFSRPVRLTEPAVLVGLFLLALVVRAITFAAFPHPAYPDSFYYSAVAREIAAGHGLTVPYLWSFVDVGSVVPAVGSLPLPSNAHWMPLASFVQVPFIWLLGPTDLASALPFMLASALLVPLTYALAHRLLGASRAVACGAALLMTFPLGAMGYLAQPDNYALFALAVTGSLWLVGSGVRNRLGVRPAALAGLLAAAAMLSRNDGFLVALAVGLTFLALGQADLRRHRNLRFPLTSALAYAAAFVLPMALWFARQIETFGTVSLSGASGRILWIRTYGEMFAADGPLSPEHLLGWDLGSLIASRLDAIGAVGATVAVLFLGVVLVPFLAAAWWRLRQRPFVALFGLYTALFLGWAIIVAAPHLKAGNLGHGAVALLPTAYSLAAVGMATTFGRVRRYDHRALAGIGLAFLLIGAVGLTVSLTNAWERRRANFVSVVDAIAAHDSGGQVRVMSYEPGALQSLDPRFIGVQHPVSDWAVIERAVRAYDIEWFYLERGHTRTKGMDGVLDGSPPPTWLGTPILVTRDAKDTVLRMVFPVLPVQQAR